MTANPSRRALLGAAAVLPLAVVPAIAAAEGPSRGSDAELLRLEQAIIAVDAEQDRLTREDEALGVGLQKYRTPRHKAIEKRQDALTSRWHALHEQVIDTSATTDAGRKAKARIILRWVQRDAAGWPMGEDGLSWSLARDVLGITDGPAVLKGAGA